MFSLCEYTPETIVKWYRSSSTESVTLHCHVSTEAQNGQTKHLLYRGPFMFSFFFSLYMFGWGGWHEGKFSRLPPATALLDATVHTGHF